MLHSEIAQSNGDVRANGIVRSHREIIADWQHGNCNLFFADQLHVVEQTGVAREVDVTVCRLQNDSRWIATVAAVG